MSLSKRLQGISPSPESKDTVQKDDESKKENKEVKSEPLHREEEKKGSEIDNFKKIEIENQKRNEEEEEYEILKEKIHTKLVEEYISSDEEGGENEEVKLKSLIKKLVSEQNITMKQNDLTKLIDDLIAEILGYGPIDSLLKDPEVTEIMVNHPKQVYVQRKGKSVKTNVKFKDDAHVIRIIEKIVSPIGRRIDESSPMVDARLPDGSRVNAMIPPISLKGPNITIRKFPANPLKISDLIRFGTVTSEMAQFLKACVEARLNIVVSGGTGSGKTTLLNVLSSFIPDEERIITIEDAAELQLMQDHVISVETRPPNIEGKGQISIRDLVKNALRQTPDRVIVGEIRGGEALDMLQAMNTGHDGSLTTGHANSPRDILSRIETMVLMSGIELPIAAIRQQMASAIHLIVQQSRLKDGTRKITYITEVTGMEGDIITLQDIFLYKQEGRDSNGKVIGKFVSTGTIPTFLDEFRSKGIYVDLSWFQKDRGDI